MSVPGFQTACWFRDSCAQTLTGSSGSPSQFSKHNKKIKKAILELASALRETKETVNMAINGDGKLIDIKKQEEKAIADILRNSIPIDRIANILEERKAEVTFENIEEMNLDGLENIDV